MFLSSNISFLDLEISLSVIKQITLPFIYSGIGIFISYSLKLGLTSIFSL